MAEEEKTNPAAALAQSIPDGPAPAAPVAPSAPTSTPSANPEPTLRLTLTDEQDQADAKTRKRPRRPPTRSTASISASKELKGVLPTNERLHVYKRSDTGEFGYCADYSTNEVTGFGTIEAFIRKFVVPHYGYGEYQLYLQKGGSGLTEAGKVTIVQPLDEPKSGSDVAKLKDILEATQKMATDAKNEGASALDGVARLMAVLKDSRGEDGKGMDPMTLMMLMQMMQKPSEPKKDLVVEALLRRLEDIESKLKAPPPMPMAQLPPPPPPPDPMASLAPVLAGFMDTMGKFAEVATRRDPPPPPPPPRDVLAEIVQMKTLFEQKNDGFGAREIIGLLPTLKDLIAPQQQQGAQSLEEQLAELRQTRAMLRELEGEFRPEGERNGGFWDNIVPMLGMLLGRQDMAANVAQGIAASQRPPQQLPPGEEEEEEESAVQVPAGFKPFAETINDESKPVAQKIGALIMGMQFLVKYESFRPAIMAIFDRLRANDKKKAIALFEAFLGAFIESGILEQKAAAEVFEGMQVHWDVIRQRMGFPDAQPKPPQQPKPNGATSPSAQAAPSPAPVPSAPAPEQAPEQAEKAPESPEPTPEPSLQDADGADIETEDEEDEEGEVELDEESYEAAARAQA